MCYKYIRRGVWLARLMRYMSGSSSMAHWAHNAHITVYDVTTWSWVNLVPQIHTHLRNAVPPVWGSLRLAPTTSLLHAFQWSILTLRASTSLLHAWRRSKRTLQTSTSILQILRKPKLAPRTSTGLIHALRKSKRTLRTTTRLIHVLWKFKRTF